MGMTLTPERHSAAVKTMKRCDEQRPTHIVRAHVRRDLSWHDIGMLSICLRLKTFSGTPIEYYHDTPDDTSDFTVGKLRTQVADMGSRARGTARQMMRMVARAWGRRLKAGP